MYTKKELSKFFEKKSIRIYETEDSVSNKTSIKLTSVDDLLDFASNQAIDTMFYYYGHISSEDLLIDDDVLSKFKVDEDGKNVLAKEIDKYNAKAEKLDYSQPVFLEIYCIYNGIIILAEEFDYWFQKKGFDFPEKVAVQMITQHLEKIVQHRKDVLENITRGREELKERMLKDSEFHKCTNATLRMQYTTKLSKEKDVHELFFKENGYPRDMLLRSFVEIVWKEYKSNKT